MPAYTHIQIADAIHESRKGIIHHDIVENTHAFPEQVVYLSDADLKDL